MSGVELVLAFLAGVVMGVAFDRFVLPPPSMRGSTHAAGKGNERGDDAPDRRRADVSSSARIGAAAALTIVLVVLLVLDVAVPDYDISPGDPPAPTRRDPRAPVAYAVEDPTPGCAERRDGGRLTTRVIARWGRLRRQRPGSPPATDPFAAIGRSRQTGEHREQRTSGP